MNNPEATDRLYRLLLAALELPSPERAKFVDRVCAADPALRQEFHSRIAATGRLPFLDDAAFTLLFGGGGIDSPESTTISIPTRDEAASGPTRELLAATFRAGTVPVELDPRIGSGQVVVPRRRLSSAALVIDVFLLTATGLAGAFVYRAASRNASGEAAGRIVDGRPAVAVLGPKNIVGEPQTNWPSTALAKGIPGRLTVGDRVGPKPSNEKTAAGASIPAEAARLYREGFGKLRFGDATTARDLLVRATIIEPSYALAHGALARAWSTLGFDGSAAEEARKAMNYAGGASREDRLWIDGVYRETTEDWDEAIDAYHALFDLFPDRIDYGLRLADCQAAGGRGREAYQTVETLRRLPEPDRNDPNIDLVEATAAQSLLDFPRAQRRAAEAGRKGIAIEAPLLVARARVIEGWAYGNLGQLDKAIVATEDAKRLYSEEGARGRVAHAMVQLGVLFRGRRDLRRAEDAYAQALGIAREIGNKGDIAHRIVDLANVLYERGRLSDAQPLYAEAVALYRNLQDRPDLASTLSNLAGVLIKQEKFSEGMNLMTEALAIRRTIGDKSEIAASLVNMAKVASDQGDLERSRLMHEESLALNRETGNHAETARSLVGLGRVLLRQGQVAEAREAQEEARNIREWLGSKSDVAESSVALAEILLEEGRTDEAVAAAQEASRAGREHDQSDIHARAFAILAAGLLERHQSVEARDALAEVRKLPQTDWERGTRMEVDIATARVDAATGASQSATTRLERVLAEANKLALAAYALEARLALAEVHLRAGNGDAGLQELQRVEDEAAIRGFGVMSRRIAAMRFSTR